LIMAQFSYRARRRSGEVVVGVLDVADRPAALIQIERLGLFPVAVEGAKAASASAKPAAPGPSAKATNAGLPPALRQLLSRQRKPKLQELATFTQQLANLLKSGMPLTVALNSMTHLESKGISKEVSQELKQEVMEGRSLSDAMAKQARVFSDLYINMDYYDRGTGSLALQYDGTGNAYTAGPSVTLTAPIPPPAMATPTLASWSPQLRPASRTVLRTGDTRSLPGMCPARSQRT
jgi:type II secretory pathway component PulF